MYLSLYPFLYVSLYINTTVAISLLYLLLHLVVEQSIWRMSSPLQQKKEKKSKITMVSPKRKAAAIEEQVLSIEELNKDSELIQLRKQVELLNKRCEVLSSMNKADKPSSIEDKEKAKSFGESVIFVPRTQRQDSNDGFMVSLEDVQHHKPVRLVGTI